MTLLEQLIGPKVVAPPVGIGRVISSERIPAKPVDSPKLVVSKELLALAKYTEENRPAAVRVVADYSKRIAIGEKNRVAIMELLISGGKSVTEILRSGSPVTEQSIRDSVRRLVKLEFVSAYLPEGQKYGVIYSLTDAGRKYLEERNSNGISQ